MLHEHIHHAVLQYLELANGLTKLFTGFAVFNGVFVQHFHTAYSLCANGQNSVINRTLNDGIALTLFAQEGIGTQSNVIKCNF